MRDLGAQAHWAPTHEGGGGWGGGSAMHEFFIPVLDGDFTVREPGLPIQESI